MAINIMKAALAVMALCIVCWSCSTTAARTKGHVGGRRFIEADRTAGGEWNNLCSCPGRAGTCDQTSIRAVAKSSTLNPPAAGISVLEVSNECGLCTVTSILADCRAEEGIAQPLPCLPLDQMLPPGPLHPHQTRSLPYNGPAGAWPILGVNFECAVGLRL